MDDGSEAERLARAVWRHIDRREFAHAGALLAEDCTVTWPATREALSRAQWVRANTEYGGDWAAVLERLVAAGGQAVTAVRVHARDDPATAYHAVSFFRVEAGRVTDLVEYWSDVEPEAPAAVARVRSGLSSRIR